MINLVSWFKDRQPRHFKPRHRYGQARHERDILISFYFPDTEPNDDEGDDDDDDEDEEEGEGEEETGEQAEGGEQEEEGEGEEDEEGDEEGDEEDEEEEEGEEGETALDRKKKDEDPDYIEMVLLMPFLNRDTSETQSETRARQTETLIFDFV